MCIRRRLGWRRRRIPGDRIGSANNTPIHERREKVGAIFHHCAIATPKNERRRRRRRGIVKTFALGYVGITDAAATPLSPGAGRENEKCSLGNFPRARQEKGDTHFVLPHISRKKRKRWLLPLYLLGAEPAVLGIQGKWSGWAALGWLGATVMGNHLLRCHPQKVALSPCQKKYKFSGHSTLEGF